mgnify:FL=1|tara:strand:- start:24826 stop:25353 length:528 start_codon:yes stop_codon:yes gene_type:complete
MRIDNKYFPAFMAVMALASALIIVYSSFSYKKTEQKRFIKSIVENDSLTTHSLNYILNDDSVSVSDFEGEHVVLVFFSSWSEKSNFMLQEISSLADEVGSIEVIAAVVKDATDTINFDELPPTFNYVDGVSLYNDLKVPGIPTYVLFDKKGKYVFAHTGYQEGSGYDLLIEHLDD